MKPPPFEYHRPTDLGEALSVLAEVGDEGKVLAGGQSLVPLLNMRLAAPGHLVDINRLGSTAELADIRVDGGTVRVGALVRHSALLHDADAYDAIPLLRQATEQVAHAVIRNRGTSVGSLVHADPAAEMPAVLVLLDGAVELRSAHGTRTVPAAEFFLGPLESAIETGELAVCATFPVPAPRTGTAWLEVSRRHGDYALAGTGVLVTLDDSGRIARATAACISVGPTPVRIELTDALIGQPSDSADWAAAGQLATGAIDPEPDIHATAAYRRHLTGVLVARAAAAAARQALDRTGVPA